MKIEREVKIDLTVKELKKIITDHFKDEFDIAHIYFHVETVYDGYDDYGSTELTGVNISAKDKQK